MVCKQSAKGFTLNCTLPHFYLCDYIAQPVWSDPVFKRRISILKYMTLVWKVGAGNSDNTIF